MTEHQAKASQPTVNQHVLNPPHEASAALRGASSAFLPKPPTTTTSLSPASSSARLAALAAGRSLATRNARLPSPQPPRDSRQAISPSRARTALGKSATNTSQSTVPSSRSIAIPIPALQQPVSAVAARYAVSQPTSPRRSPTRAPLSPRYEDNTEAGHDADAISGALASAASLQNKQEELPAPDGSEGYLGYFSNVNSTPKQAGQGFGATEQHVQTTNLITFTPKSLVPIVAVTTPHAPALLDVPSLETPRFVKRQKSQIMLSMQDTRSSGIATTLTSTSTRASSTHRSWGGGQRPRLGTANSRSSQDDIDAEISRMADAIVASSLASSMASSRNASPSKDPTRAPVRRRSSSFSTLRDEPIKPAPPPRGQRPMKHTLRTPSSEGEDPEPVKRGRRHIMRKHPHMHQEGDRKRWRDTITERERKRYEGVFAANRGLLIGPGHFEPSPSALADQSIPGNRVVNVIVRDIFERSRLPQEILMEIYDLVSPEEALSLNRDQFVVGLWLVDQRLKGRKLPVKVSASVWTSLRASQGIKMRYRG